MWIQNFFKAVAYLLKCIAEATKRVRVRLLFLLCRPLTLLRSNCRGAAATTFRGLCFGRLCLLKWPKNIVNEANTNISKINLTCCHLQSFHCLVMLMLDLVCQPPTFRALQSRHCFWPHCDLIRRNPSSHPLLIRQGVQ